MKSSGTLLPPPTQAHSSSPRWTPTALKTETTPMKSAIGAASRSARRRSSARPRASFQRGNVAIAHPAAGEQIVVQEQCAEALGILQLPDAQQRHRNGDEPLDRAHREDRAEGRLADGEPDEKGDGEDRDDRLAFRFVLSLHGRCRDACAGRHRHRCVCLDPGLWRCLHAVFGHQGVNRFACLQMLIFDKMHRRRV